MGNMMLATDLHRLVHNALLFAKSDVPAIDQIRLEFGTDQVLSVATDRYVLGVTRADYQGEPMVIQLSRADAQNLVKLAKTGRTTFREVHIEHGPGDRVSFAFTTGEALAVECTTEDFPKFRQLIPTEPLRHDAITGFEQHIGFDPTKLAVFTKVISGIHTGNNDGNWGVALTLQGPGKPALIQVGPDFTGLLMPVRGHAAFKRPAWLDAEVVTVVTEVAS